MSIYHNSQTENTLFTNNLNDESKDKTLSSVIFSQTTPSPTPFFGGYIQVMLCLSILGLPIAIIFGIIRGIIERKKIEKMEIKRNTITISNSNFLTIILDREINIRNSDIKSISSIVKTNISFGMFPFAIITHNYTYGSLKIKTTTETYKIKNIANVYGVSRIIDYLIHNPTLTDKLLASNNKTLYDFYGMINYLSNSTNSKSCKTRIEEFFNSI